MARFSILITGLALLVCSGFAQADLSPTAEFIRTRPYLELNTDNPIGTITAGDVDKASGIVASVGHGLAVWADGRSGDAVIMGYDLANPGLGDNPGFGEFLISDETDTWQEGNPFAGYNVSASGRWVVSDTANVGVSGGDQGDIEGSVLPPSPTSLVTDAGRQQSPVFTNVITSPVTTYLSWMHYPGGTDPISGEIYVDIYTKNGATTNITSGTSAPRDSLAGDGNYLVWQEIRSVGTFPDVTTSWDIAYYDFASPGINYIDAPTAGKPQINPDVSGNLVVWTEVEEYESDGTLKVSNIYFQDLTSAAGPVAITTTGTAAEAAISRTTANNFVVNGNDGPATSGVTAALMTYFVVWQDHRNDSSKSTYAGGNTQEDYNWDIWGQEVRFDAGKGEWDLYKDPFNILDATAAGRQTLPDIDGLNVVWQSQAPGVEDIYVWGPVPEPSSLILLACGGLGVLLKRKRAKARRGGMTSNADLA